MHACCAPCSVACVDSLREEGLDLTYYWYNPNIHPYTEYRARKNTLVDYAQRIGVPLLMDDDYGLRDFLSIVGPDYDHRCGQCYDTRLQRTAKRAAEEGFDAFTTTLLISPYQDHERLMEAGDTAARLFGTAFLYRDFRPLFRGGQDRAREMGLYMQKYCGCLFSEEERYSKAYKKKKKGRADSPDSASASKQTKAL